MYDDSEEWDEDAEMVLYSINEKRNPTLYKCVRQSYPIVKEKIPLP